MTIELDKNRPQTITMDINIEGIEKDKLNFAFRIGINDNMCIGFTPKLKSGNKLEIFIPPLNSKIKDLNPGRYTAKLEIDDGEKYFMMPWSGEVVIKEEPVVSVNMNEDKKLEDSSFEIDNVKQKDVKPKVTVKQENKKVKKIKKEENPMKKMTKEDALKFVSEARKRFKNENEEVLNEFISKKLAEHGFKYNPKKKVETKKQNVNEINSKQDVINYLKSKGMKSESTLNSIMERLDSQTGGNIQGMYDMARKMVEPHDQQEINTPEDMFKYVQQSANVLGNNYRYNTNDDESVSDEEKSNLLEQIKKNKQELDKQLNNN